MTRSVSALDNANLAEILRLIRTFTAFNADNDPHGEHDFVSVEHNGTRYFANIEYYDPSMEFAADDPADAARTLRVMTIMRADQY